MARIKDRQKALELRKNKHYSYSQIKNLLGISKSTLSYWLRNYPLSKGRIQELRDRNETRIERYRKTMRMKHHSRLRGYFLEEREKLLPLSEREIFIAGLFLYWGEGSKTSYNTICISNSDPLMVKFSVYWLIKSLSLPRNKIKVALHLYSDMDVGKEIKFWREKLKMNTRQFLKPYIKKSTTKELTHRGFGHGTCCLVLNNTEAKERILMAIKAVAEHYAQMI
jgi:transcriptional regulator with XRE-family HTH domain